MGVDSVDAVARVEVLDNHHLEAGGGTLAGSNGRVCQEELPDLARVSFHVGEELMLARLTLNHFSPYVDLTFSAFPSQFLYHLQRVPE